MGKRVVIIGGGVAGLTAAHELIERGFDVSLYEYRTTFGGKAASLTTDNGLPGEHGFRFFPGWYQHLPDTMRRIPYKNRRVYDNLVQADMNLFASYHRDAVRALLRFPTSLDELKTAHKFPQELARLGLSSDDVSFFFSKLAEFAFASEETRLKKFEHTTWWDLLEADKRSQAFRDYLVDGVTRNTIAANPKQASAYTIAKVAIQTLLDTVRPGHMVDRVLNGPTSEVWIEPWVDYLRAQGVNFYTDAELDSIEIEHRRVKCVRVQEGNNDRRNAAAKLAILQLLKPLAVTGPLCVRLPPPPRSSDFADIVARWRDRVLTNPAVIAAISESESQETLRKDRDEWTERERLQSELYEASDFHRFGAVYEEAQRELSAAQRRVEESALRRVEADFYVMALPVEQMAYYVHRGEMLRREDPSLRNIILLSEHVDWMAGIQFYLTEKVDITRGHIDCLDSEWHLTAISQKQFWPDVDLKERGVGPARKVKSILSVDISAWDKKGFHVQKEAFNCTREEIAEEVWRQLCASLNRPNTAPVLCDEILLGYKGKNKPFSRECFYLDEHIIDRYDRKKQAFYQKIESVRFSSEALIERQATGEDERDNAAFAYGDRRVINAEPLLINRPGAIALRPTARTRICNLMLAGDYVRTNTHLATMEAANEAGRAAVNEILLNAGVKQELCKIWSLWEPSDLLRVFAPKVTATLPLTAAALPQQLMAGAASAAGIAGRFASRAFERFVERK